MKARTVPAIVLVIYLGVLGGTEMADPNINATALLRAAKALDLGHLAALAASISSLMLAGTVVATGTLADRLGRKKVLAVGLIAVAIGDILVMLASDSAMFMVGRVIAGIGMGAVFGAAFAYVKLVATGKGGLAAAVGTFMAVGAVAAVTMTFAGGVLAGIEWRVAYLLVPVVSLIALVVGMIILPGDDTADRPAGSWDLLGQVMLGLGVIGVLFGVAHIPAGFGAPLTLAPLVAGAILLIGFVAWERHCGERAFYPSDLFTNPVFIAAILIGLVFHLSYGAALLSFTGLFQITLGLTDTALALGQLPFLVAGIIAAFVFAKVWGDSALVRRGAMAIGTGSVVLGFAALAIPAWGGSHSYWSYVIGMILIGGGSMIASIPFGSMFLDLADTRHLGPVAASRTTVGQSWLALGLAGSTVIIDGLTRHEVRSQLGAPAAGEFEEWAVSEGKVPAPAQVLDVVGTVYPSAFAWGMAIVGAVCLAAGVAAVIIVTRGHRTWSASASEASRT